MPTTYLIIAHLLTDFTLQSNRLVAWKTKQFRGVIVHVCIFTAIALIILFPYLIYWQTWTVIGAISVFHLIVDQTKINIALRYDKYAFPFIADQALHFLSLIVGGYYLSNLPLNLPNEFFFTDVYTNKALISVVLTLIFVGYIIKILFFQKDRSLKMNTSKIISFTIVYIFYVGVALF